MRWVDVSVAALPYLARDLKFVSGSAGKLVNYLVNSFKFKAAILKSRTQSELNIKYKYITYIVLIIFKDMYSLTLFFIHSLILILKMLNYIKKKKRCSLNDELIKYKRRYTCISKNIQIKFEFNFWCWAIPMIGLKIDM